MSCVQRSRENNSRVLAAGLPQRFPPGRRALGDDWQRRNDLCLHDVRRPGLLLELDRCGPRQLTTRIPLPVPKPMPGRCDWPARRRGLSSARLRRESDGRSSSALGRTGALAAVLKRRGKLWGRSRSRSSVGRILELVCWRQRKRGWTKKRRQYIRTTLRHLFLHGC